MENENCPCDAEQDPLPRRSWVFSFHGKLVLLVTGTFVVTILLVEFLAFFGAPFHLLRGALEHHEDEAARSLSLVADQKESRLLHWCQERRNDVAWLVNNHARIGRIEAITQAFADLEKEGITDQDRWAKLGEQPAYQTLEKRLKEIQSTYRTTYKRISLVDARSATVILSTDEAELGRNVGKSDFFRKPLEQKGAWLGELDTIPDSTHLLLHVSEAVRQGDGTPLAVLVLQVDLEEALAPLLHTGEGLGIRGEALLVDRNARILTSLKHPLLDGTKPKPLQYRITAEPAVRAAQQERGVINALDYRDEPVLAAYRYLEISPGYGWGMVVKRDRAELLAPLMRNLRRTLYFDLVGLATIVILVSLGTHRFTRPLRVLSETANRVTQGDLTARADIHSRDEVGTLAVALNTMIDRLANYQAKLEAEVKARTAELSQANSQLSTEIAEHKEVKEALRHANVDLNQIFDASVPMAVIDNQCNVIRVNNTYCELFGVSEEDLLKRTCYSIQGNRHCDSLECPIKRIAQGEKRIQFELDIQTHSGQKLSCAVTATPYFGPDNELLGMVQTLLDITERKEAEQALRQSEATLKSVFSAAPIGIALASNRILQWGNDQFCEMIGYPPNEFDGQDTCMFYETAEEYRRVGDVVYARNPAHLPVGLETRLRRRDGTVFDVHLRAAFVDPDNDSNTVVFAVMDITDRKHAEEALKHRLLALTRPSMGTTDLKFSDLFDVDEIQEIQNAFAESTGVASLITDVDGHPITRPSNFCRLCSDIIRKTEKGLRNCMKSDAALGQDSPDGPSFQRCLSGGFWDAGTSIRAGNRHVANWLIGQVFTDEDSEEQMLDYAREIGANEEEYRSALKEVNRMPLEQFQRVSRFLFLFAKLLSRLALQNIQQAKDISERQRAQEELARHRDRLEELVGERTRELEATQQALLRKERLAALGQLTASVSHELRNPLGTIRTSFYLIAKQMRGNDAKVDRTLDRIERNIVRCDTIIDDLLDYSRVRPLTPVETNLDDWLASLLAEQEIPPNVLVSKQLTSNTAVWIDRERLHRCVVNVLSNAVQAMGNEGGNLTLATVRQDGHIAIRISDTGTGIPSDARERIFEPLYSTKTFGVGLGLSIVRQIIQQHGGSVEIDSQLGFGTTITLRLPLEKPRESTHE